MIYETTEEIILASSSPRRKELLERLGLQFIALASGVEEPLMKKSENAETYARNLSSIKASAIFQDYPNTVVIGADTVVVKDGKVYPKPVSNEQAEGFLHDFSGQIHSVITGVTILSKAFNIQFSQTTEVMFRELDDAWIKTYVATGDSLDKAGGYGIQTAGAFFVKEIHGSYDNVVGLPLAELSAVLWKYNVIRLKEVDQR